MDTHGMYSHSVLASLKSGVDRGRPVRGPVDVQIMPLLECNARCKFCPLFALPKSAKDTSVPRFHVTPEMLDYNLFRDFVTDVRALGEVCRVHFTGGEPLMHPRIANMVDDFRTAFPAAEIVVVTNGILLEEQIGDLLDAGVSKISISLNAGTESAYRRINPMSPPGEFASICDGVRATQKTIVKRAPAVHLSVTSVLTCHTYREVREHYEIIRRAGVDSLTFIPLVPFTIDGREHLERLGLTADEFAEFRTELAGVQEEAARHGAYVGYCGTESDGGRIAPTADDRTAPCFTGYTFAMIWPDGTVRPCCACETPLGNLKTHRFREIWESAAYSKFRTHAVEAKDALPDSCACNECGYIAENRLYRDYLGLAPSAPAN